MYSTNKWLKNSDELGSIIKEYIIRNTLLEIYIFFNLLLPFSFSTAMTIGNEFSYSFFICLLKNRPTEKHR